MRKRLIGNDDGKSRREICMTIKKPNNQKRKENKRP
jgi:hypothetical protein